MEEMQSKCTNNSRPLRYTKVGNVYQILARPGDYMVHDNKLTDTSNITQ